MAGDIVPFRPGLSRSAAQRRIRDCADDTAHIAFPLAVGKHMAKSGITMRQLIETLRGGDVCENPSQDEHGNWICVLQRRIAGRHIHVVVALGADGQLTIVETF